MKTIWMMLLLAAGAFAAEPTRGLQLVLLHCWGPAGVRTMNAVLAAYAPSDIEIASAPYLDHSCTMWGLASNATSTQKEAVRFGNLVSTIRTLRAQSARNVRVTVHVGCIHETKPGKNNEGCTSTLSWRMTRIWLEVFAPFLGDPRVKFSISPSLEDYYSDSEYRTAVDQALSALDRRGVYNLFKAGRLEIRRSGGAGVDSYRAYVGTAEAFTADVKHEAHGSAPQSGFGIWSNDGRLVYYDSRENHSQHQESLLKSGRLSLAQFQANDKYQTGKLIWRPAFNLYNKSAATSGGKQIIVYSKPAMRTDTAAGKFDADEASGLIRFLRNQN